MDRVGEIIESPVQIRCDRAANRCKDHAAGLALEQRRTRPFLQGTDMLCDGAGRDTELVGGARKTADTRGGFKGAQRIQGRTFGSGRLYGHVIG